MITFPVLAVCKFLLIGDSIAAGFGGRLGPSVINSGVVSDYPAHMATRLPLAMQRCPNGDVVIEIGVNRTKMNLKYHSYFLAKTHNIVRYKRKHLYILGIPSKLNNMVGILNKYYENFAKKHKDVTFLPVPPNVQKYLKKDKVHLKRHGYKIWSKKLKKQLGLSLKPGIGPI